MSTAAPPLSPAAKRRLVAGLLPAIFLGAIDGQIVPVALLTIGRALGEAWLIAWVMAALSPEMSQTKEWSILRLSIGKSLR